MRGDRRVVVGGALALQAAVVAAVAVDLPFLLRMPVAVAYVLLVPGFAVAGHLRLDDPVSELALSVALSITAGIAVAQGLVWLGAYSLTATLAVLAAVTVVGLLGQLVAVGAGRPSRA